MLRVLSTECQNVDETWLAVSGKYVRVYRVGGPQSAPHLSLVPPPRTRIRLGERTHCFHAGPCLIV